MPYRMNDDGVELVDESPQESLQLIADASPDVAKMLAWAGLTDLPDEQFFTILNIVYNWARMPKEARDAIDLDMWLKGAEG